MEYWNIGSITPIFHSLSHLAFENFQAFVAVGQVE